MFGFVKNRQSNINPKEAEAIKLLAREFLGYTDDDLKKALETGELVEVSYE
ncbi:type II toxin-antitoxin system RelE/ParE family toxin [Endozoicomonas sp. SESOKO1]|uniref:type II toxin-antitoxin system RelE/ParE family toxin n=1 Tax=Endozoicomonas sp. SESOKO1 TaxID=2828742 RepID=UPI0035A11132